ncbi:MAG: adenylate/guanylate cyclase domain-containing protein, partial [Acidimicrobiia bacterium]
GVPLEGLASAVREGTLSFAYLDVSAFDWFAGLTSTTFGELSATSGISLELLALVRESFGYAEPRPQDYVREDELAVIQAIDLLQSHGYQPEIVVSLLRVYADSLRRIAEAETQAYRTEVELPLLESGMTEREMLDAQAEIGSLLTPGFEQALIAMYHGQQERTWTKSAVDDIERVLEREGLYSRISHPPAVSFLDLTGYTRLTEEEGDEAAADLAAELRALVRKSSLEHRGESVKWLGDGVMFYFPDPSQGLMGALDMVEGIAARGLPPARVGIHAGPVIFQEGDYFGRTVNIASRMADYARPGEVLVSEEVVEAASATPVTFNAIGPVTLKGVTDPLSLYTAHRSD